MIKGRVVPLRISDWDVDCFLPRKKRRSMQMESYYVRWHLKVLGISLLRIYVQVSCSCSFKNRAWILRIGLVVQGDSQGNATFHISLAFPKWTLGSEHLKSWHGFWLSEHFSDASLGCVAWPNLRHAAGGHASTHFPPPQGLQGCPCIVQDTGTLHYHVTTSGWQNQPQWGLKRCGESCWRSSLRTCSAGGNKGCLID